MRARGPGSRLAPRYEVVEHLARSNVLDVYDAWSDELGSRCIVKTLRPDRRGDEKARTRLLREGKLLEDLRHPGIVRGYETLREPHPLVAMETLGGETVAHLLDRRRRALSAVELGFLGLHVASAMRYLHGKGWLHLDLKPSNVVAENGRTKVIDLSLVRRPGDAPAGVGTWCYMAPEQARGGRLEAAADVWGVGVLLYEAASGDTPFSDEDVEYPQLEQRAPPLRTLRRLPRPLTEVVDACLEPEAAARPTLAELIAVLQGVAGARG